MKIVLMPFYLRWVPTRTVPFVFCDDSLRFGLRASKFFDTWQTQCNIVTSDTTCMECTHCQLSTRFTDGLRCNNTYSFTNLNLTTCTKVATIALTTYAIKGCDKLIRNGFNCFIVFYNFISQWFCDFTIKRNDNFGFLLTNSSAAIRPTIRIFLMVQ